MDPTEGTPRRIITIDDNDNVHQDFRAILTPRPRHSALDELEETLFGGDAAGSANRGEEPVYEIECALQGEEGVEMIRRAKSEDRGFSLAFVDMRMPPGWDGVETTRRIWEADSSVQVVICTAYSSYTADELAARFRGTDSLLILKKPFEPVEILQMANTLTEKWILARKALIRLTEMRQLVEQRTRELEAANAELTVEINLRREKEVELERLSRLDGLTGVANRRTFDQILAEEWALAGQMGEPLSLIMLDLDYFKEFNDWYGHLAGDDCLCRVAQTLANVPLRKRNLFARYGGEEFALILPQTDAEGARVVAERVRETVLDLAIPHERSPSVGLVTLSAGVATRIPDGGAKVDSLLVRADSALYQAKRAGRNQVACDEGQ